MRQQNDTKVKQNSRLNRHGIAVSVLLTHLVIILAWQSKHYVDHSPTKKAKVLFYFDITQAKKNKKETRIQKIDQSNLNNNLHSRKQTQNRSLPTDSEPKSISNQKYVTTQLDLVPTENNTQSQSRPIEKNIQDLTQILKEDFLKQEKNDRPDPNNRHDSLKKFSNAVAAAAQIQRDGVQIEKKYAYDGRPVSKIKTPYGTYCIRHPKAGEKPELSPPALPVSCGQL